MHSEHLTNISIDNLTVFLCAHYIYTVGTAVFSPSIFNPTYKYFFVCRSGDLGQVGQTNIMVWYALNIIVNKPFRWGDCCDGHNQIPSCIQEWDIQYGPVSYKKKILDIKKYYYKMIQNTYQKNKNCNKMINSNQILLALILK